MEAESVCDKSRNHCSVDSCLQPGKVRCLTCRGIGVRSVFCRHHGKEHNIPTHHLLDVTNEVFEVEASLSCCERACGLPGRAYRMHFHSIHGSEEGEFQLCFLHQSLCQSDEWRLPVLLLNNGYFVSDVAAPRKLLWSSYSYGRRTQLLILIFLVHVFSVELLETALRMRKEGMSYQSICGCYFSHCYASVHDSVMYKPFIDACHQFYLIQYDIDHCRLNEAILSECGVGKTECPCRGGAHHYGQCVRTMDAFYSASHRQRWAGGGEFHPFHKELEI